MGDELVDRIYEAAFVPELWPSALESMVDASGSASGGLLVFDGERPVGVRATAATRDLLEDFASGDNWRQSARIRHFQANPITGFVHADDYFSPELQESDAIRRDMQARGLDWQAGTIIPLPTGEVVVFTFEQRAEHGRHNGEAMALFQSLHPHLARAGMMSARLKLERAHGTVATLQTMGLPGAVMAVSGRALATNALFEAMPDVIVPRAREGVALADATAQSLFAQAMERTMADASGVQSVPVAATEKRPACVVHILPLRRAAQDIFSQAEILVAVTTPSASAMVPSPQLLRGLFDLTPAEARLAAALAAGRTLREAAASNGNRFSTARSQLESIFRKTGSNRQSQLVALLQSAGPLKRDA